MSINIVPTQTTLHLAKKLEKTANFKIIYPALNKEGKRYFPDGEIYIRIPEKIQDRVVVLHSGSPKPNDCLIELELILEILKKAGIQPEVFFTYFSYGQQDKVFREGETAYAEDIIKKLIKYYNVKKIYIIDPHFYDETWVKKYPVVSLSAVETLKNAAEKNSPGIVFVAPDEGSIRRTGLKGAKKHRKDSFNVEANAQVLAEIVKGKIIGVIDDIVETGGTLGRFYDAGKKLGAQKIAALITHGVLASGIEKIKIKYDKLYLTNTINQKEANIDITSLIIEGLKGEND